jgi:hypothetical protein
MSLAAGGAIGNIAALPTTPWWRPILTLAVTRPAHPSCPSIVTLLALLLLGCGSEVTQLSYDGDGVAMDVLALVPHNTEWARSQQPEAVLYRIELRSDTPSDTAPQYALYSYFAPSTRTFLTATSDPKVPWDGAEAQDWPADQPVPLPLPPIRMDFREAWRKARAAGLTNATSAVLEVNRRTALPIVTWSIVGTMPDVREGGAYFNALTGDRVRLTLLADPPMSPTLLDRFTSQYRSALRGTSAGSARCSGRSIAIPEAAPVVCYDVPSRQYSPPADEK